MKRRRPKPLNPVRRTGPDFRNVERGKRELSQMIADSERRDEVKSMMQYDAHYEEILVCTDCFRYSKYPEQWKQVTTDDYRKCASCGMIKDSEARDRERGKGEDER